MDAIGLTSPLLPTDFSHVASRSDDLSKADEPASARQKEQVALEFESAFLSLLLKEMRQTLEGGGFFQGDGADVYGGLFDLYLGQHLAESHALGIGQIISRYIE